MAQNTAGASDVELTDVDALEDTPHAEVFETRPPRTVRLSLDADQRVPKHQHPESLVVIYVCSGTIELTLGDEVHELSAGGAVRFDGAQDVSPLAVEDSEALVVFAPKDGVSDSS